MGRCRKRSIIVALVPILLAGCSENEVISKVTSPPSGSESSGSTSTVEQDFATLKRALLNGDSQVAASLVTAGTLREYETCRTLALDSSDTDFAELNPVTVMMVFQFRYLLARSQLQEMSGRDIFEWGVSGGLIKKETLRPFEIHKVQYDGETAFATVTQNGNIASDGMFTFRKEDGCWKFDLMEIARIGGKQLDDVRKQAGKTKVELVVYLLEQTYGKSIPPRILDGPLK